MRVLLSAIFVSTAILMTGCASIVSKSSFPVTINSSPSGMNVRIRDENGVVVHEGSTPYTVTLKASNGFFDGMDYVLEADGASTPLTSSINGWYFGNIIFGGLIGLLIVDPATGAMWTLPDNAFIQSGYRP